MLFVRYENWKSFLRYYPVTSLILLINLAVFIFLSFNGGSTNPQTLADYGAVTNVPMYDQWWRVITAIFLHNGFSHLLSNSFGLIVFAPPLERLIGSWRYVVLYMASGIIGNVISLELYQQSGNSVVAVGASGAIYGIYGAFLYIALFQRQIMDEASRKTMYTILVLGLIFTFVVPGIGIWAHVGGLIAGFFIYGLMLRLTGLRGRWRRLAEAYAKSLSEQENQNKIE
ncbi:rhomboid family intramembrane serine protease [Paenibacillus sp. KACC 21273]|uniref:rhomboid family intramembrane serine protease n=1 Tax=Paenibacillus sp. KACC 21273 TaxID=3025665 RepID=UPI002366ECB7|nr:rhomboid family intramembrane serine protease [Paenibacillus sp. KACC 21273]WDF49498.1 rhomboid family intramembrane serine protease [Paenibacillus sp. KACC 21273]